MKLNSIALNGSKRKLKLKASNLNERKEWNTAIKAMINYANANSCPDENYVLTDLKPWKVIFSILVSCYMTY